MTIRRRIIAVVAPAAVGLFIAVPSAFGSAAANPNASCVGSGSSPVAPGQALNAFAVPGERAQISEDVQAMAAALGTTPGQLVAGAAYVHRTAGVCFPAG